MKLHGNAEILSLYMDGQLDRELRSSLESHLANCPGCRETLQRMREAKNLMTGTAQVEPPATLEKEIIAGLPGKKYFPPALRRMYLPAIGTLTVFIVVSLLIHENVKKGQAFQIARTPERAETAADSPPEGQVSKQRKDESTFTASREREEIPAVSGNVEPTVPVDEKILSDASGADRIKPGEAVPEKKEKSAERDTCIGFEYAAKAPAAALKESRNEAMSPASRKPGLNAIVIRNSDDWGKMWQTQNSMQNLSLPLPEVDFREKMVVALPSRVEDKEYTFVNTLEEKDRIVVEYKETPLRKNPLPPYQLNVVNQKPVVELQKIE